MIRKKAKSDPFVAPVTEDNIYILECKNRHGQTTTIGIASTLAEAEKTRDEWIETNDTRYWRGDKDKPEVTINTKPVVNTNNRITKFNMI